MHLLTLIIESLDRLSLPLSFVFLCIHGSISFSGLKCSTLHTKYSSIQGKDLPSNSIFERGTNAKFFFLIFFNNLFKIVQQLLIGRVCADMIRLSKKKKKTTKESDFN